jgi:hypothetical protein
MRQTLKNLRSLWRAAPIAPAEQAPLSLLVCAMAIGLLLGLLAPQTNQEGIDGSLVLAGIVHYPPESPMYQYFLGSWTLIHQLSALLLRAGLDQAYVNETIFLVPCALFVGAYAAVIYCFSGQFLLSLMAAALFYLANPLARYFASPDYMMVGLPWSQPPIQTFGFWAHAGSLWVIGCVAAGRKALAGFSVLLLIAVHPVLGVYMLALLIGALLVGRLFLGVTIEGFAKGAAWGACLTLLSLVVYLRMRPDLSAPIDQAAYDAYMSMWDTHRSHVMTSAAATRIAVAEAIAIAVLFAFIVLARPRREAAMLTAVMVLLAVIASTVAYFTMHLAPQFLPEVIFRAAPGRLLIIQAFLSTPLALALALHAASQAARDWTTGATAAWIGRVIPVGAVVFVLLELARAVHSRYDLMRDDVQMLLTMQSHGDPSLPGEGSAAFWRDVRRAGVTGQVLTTHSTSRPTLLYGHLPAALAGGFDYIPYIPQTAGATARIIEKGYGVSFSNPPVDMRHSAGLSPNAGRAYWAQLTPSDWCRISGDLDVDALIAPRDWTLELPPVVTGVDFTLYRIACNEHS